MVELPPARLGSGRVGGGCGRFFRIVFFCSTLAFFLEFPFVVLPPSSPSSSPFRSRFSRAWDPAWSSRGDAAKTMGNGVLSAPSAGTVFACSFHSKSIVDKTSHRRGTEGAPFFFFSFSPASSVPRFPPKTFALVPFSMVSPLSCRARGDWERGGAASDDPGVDNVWRGSKKRRKGRKKRSKKRCLREKLDKNEKRKKKIFALLSPALVFSPLLFFSSPNSLSLSFSFPLSFFLSQHQIQRTTTMRRTVKGGKAPAKKASSSSGAQFYGPDR